MNNMFLVWGILILIVGSSSLFFIESVESTPLVCENPLPIVEYKYNDSYSRYYFMSCSNYAKDNVLCQSLSK